MNELRLKNGATILFGDTGEKEKIRSIGGVWNWGPVATDDILLREPETCGECGRVFASLYPIHKCFEHIDLEKLKD